MSYPPPIRAAETAEFAINSDFKRKEAALRCAGSTN
jgi:hypothetical protein